MTIPPAPKSAETFAPRPVTIVVVDDDPTLVETLAALLGAEGYAVEGFTDPVQALARLRLAPAPDLALVDCIMPGLHGVELCEALDASGVDLPVMLMTALADPGFAVHPERASVLSKPFLIEDLLAEIDDRLREVRTRAPGSGPRTLRGLAPARSGGA